MTCFHGIELERILYHAGHATLGGDAGFQGNNGDRLETKCLSKYQITGQLSEAGLFLFVGRSFAEYDVHRSMKNKNPWKGDPGWDLPDKPWNVKGTKWNGEKDILDYHLANPPWDIKEGVVYIQSLVYPGVSGDSWWVMLTGWEVQENMDYRKNWYGQGERLVVMNRFLRPLRELPA